MGKTETKKKTENNQNLKLTFELVQQKVENKKIEQLHKTIKKLKLAFELVQNNDRKVPPTNGEEEGPFPSGKTNSLHDQRLLSSDWRS